MVIYCDNQVYVGTLEAPLWKRAYLKERIENDLKEINA